MRRSYNDPGHAHYLTFSCFRRCQVFTDDCACLLLAQSIEAARQRMDFDLWSYVFMPAHVHLLVRPRCNSYSTSSILKHVKGSFAKSLVIDWKGRRPNRLKRIELRSHDGSQYRVWQRGGGFDRNIHSYDAVLKAVEYIEWNPVRAGYVDNPADWKWSSAYARANMELATLLIDTIE